MKLFSRLVPVFTLAATGVFADLMVVQGSGTLETLSSRQGMGYGVTNGPVVLETGIVFTAGGSKGAGAILGTGTYFLSANGVWGENGHMYMGVNNAYNAWIRLELPTLADQVSAFFNYAPVAGTTPTIVALNSSLEILESYNLASSAPIQTPQQENNGAYRGISRAAGDIKYFELRNAFIVASSIRFRPALVEPPDPGGEGGTPSDPPSNVATIPEPVSILPVELAAVICATWYGAGRSNSRRRTQ
ncbi:hypothetical protein F183_A11560 [Bryobacterales bacterium F-183]|nr:hypothetical protein F183_A11560 [Bryobacterales bacterium F-183]